MYKVGWQCNTPPDEFYKIQEFAETQDVKDKIKEFVTPLLKESSRRVYIWRGPVNQNEPEDMILVFGSHERFALEFSELKE